LVQTALQIDTLPDRLIIQRPLIIKRIHILGQSYITAYI